MYNRYIPQNDGSYHRNRMPDPCRQQPAPPPPPPPQEPCPHPSCHPQEPCHQPSRPPQGQRVGGFLRQLIPQDFDTGDLLIVLLLLLMAGDCPENQNTALLTLAIYLFL